MMKAEWTTFGETPGALVSCTACGASTTRLLAPGETEEDALQRVEADGWHSDCPKAKT